ncbi:MAG: ATP-binding protein, partial [Robiginitalea sp.]
VDTVWTHLTLVHLEENAFTYRMTGRNGERIMAEEKISLDASEHWSHISDAVKDPDKDPDPITRFEVPAEGLDAIWELFDGIFSKLPEGEKVSPGDFPNGLFTTQAYCKFGFLGLNQPREATEEEADILLRFTTEFARLYQRFLDLQDAEERAREAQIEAALERVRAKTMAMHNSQDVAETVATLFQEVMKLGLDDSIRCGIGILEGNEGMETWSANFDHKGDLNLKMGMLDMTIHPMLKSLKKAWEKGEKGYSYHFKGEDVTRYYTALNKEPEYPFHADLSTLPDNQFARTFFFAEGILFSFTETPLTKEANRVLERFASVFGQTYRRYLDLLKAEAQAREAQIEAALERVRARAMAMHKTEELGDVLCVLFEQFDFLGINPVLTHLTLFDEESETFSFRMTTSPESKILVEQIIDINAVEAWKDAFKVWKDSDPNVVNCIDYPPEALPQVWDLMSEVMNALPKKHRIYPEDFPDGLYTVQGHCQFGYLGFNNKRKPTKEEIEIVRKFATEFGRLYQRFLDLKKAEAQAREAQIEAALERVRARTMAMHKSEELGEVAAVLFEQINNLGATLERLNIGIVREDEEIIAWWSTEQGGRQIDRLFKGSIHEPTTISKVYAAWKEGTKSLELDQTGQELKQWIRYVTEEIGLPFDPKLMQERRVHAAAFFKHGTLLVSTPEPLPEGSINLLERFAAVFEQTYTRFLDLQKAEKQARESEIEAALERVRAKTMAMHNTDDIADTVVTFFEELVGLGLDDTMRAGIGILSQSEQMQLWTASVSGTSKTILHTGSLDMSSHPTLEGVKSAWVKGDAYFSYVLQGEELKNYFQNLNEAPDYPVEFDLNKLPETVHHRSIPFMDGILFAFTETPLPEDIINILERFATVFGQTYTRYLDLEKAEKRARESRIEAALERVRAKALAMHSSEDLRETITAIFEELKHLNVRPLRLGLGLLNPDKPEGKVVTSRINENEQILEVGGEFELVGHPVLEGVYGHWKKQMDYYPILEGDEINAYYTALTRSVDVQGFGTDERHYGCFLFFREGGLYAWAAEPHSEEQISILKRFSRVLEIAYRRYNDLVESEAREKEAIKQASLDRVRAEIASMRTTEDLERITPLVWKELTTLGIPFFRCGVFIMDEASQMVHVYLTTPEGEALAVMDLPFDFKMPLIQKGVAHWRKQETLVEHWSQRQFVEMTKMLMEQGQVSSAKSYQAGEKPPERLVLHQVPFAQGMLYVGSTQTLSDAEMDIVQALTRTFAVAYARYEDFNQLEKTLGELKATQKQLIHSEKMASLGELTAGIAHEIKNPLNFVNNFSEVSKELMEELMEEMEKGDLEEVRELAGDVVQNLEKIVHHGQRADSIVKGMLQHSRSGDGQKEPTDLNALADEYLRLAYHGLRAKDKSFNAAIETDFDPGIGTIDLIPQDIGRVILNLLTNAFYTVNEKAMAARSLEKGGYKPTVSVRTKRQNDLLELSVTDNGSGIPQKVLDKIFQPFFTTKPTGEGTGLGLSLSYDIVKAHGGELSAESEEGVGTTFFIKFKTTS